MTLKGFWHLVHFTKEWIVVFLGQLPGNLLLNPVSYISAGVSWLLLLSGLCFFAAVILRLLKRDMYWLPLAAGIMISQTAIMLNWSDLRWATLINIGLLIVVIVAAAASRFKSRAARDTALLKEEAAREVPAITSQSISRLPATVQRWLQRSGVVDRKMANVFRVVQKGYLRTSQTGRWMPFHAVQHFSFVPPAFVWEARIKASPLMEIGGRDKYYKGRGHMLIKPLYVFTAADGLGKEIDQGTLLRFLAEIAWFPHAAVSPYLRWESIDERHARVTMEYEGISASGTYRFNTEGLVEGFEAQRYGDFGGIYRKEKWSVSVTGYKTFNGIPTGYATEVTWKLKEGDFTWLRMELEKIEPVTPTS